jgi:hypothetical protein
MVCLISFNRFGIPKIKRNIQKKKLPPPLKNICYLAPQAQGSIYFLFKGGGKPIYKEKKVLLDTAFHL